MRPESADMTESPEATPEPEVSLSVHLDAYEGPLHTLLDLARRQKIDLKAVSMSALADEYLSFIAEAEALQLELAGDFLVMASWLAYLKSRLLLPEEPEDEELSPQELAKHLAIRLKHLELMRGRAEAIFERPQLGQDVFMRGLASGVHRQDTPEYDTRLSDLLAAYAHMQKVRKTYKPPEPKVYALELARDHLRQALPHVRDWTPLSRLLPRRAVADEVPQSSYHASGFSAALELTKEQKASLRQPQPDHEIELKDPEPTAPETTPSKTKDL